MAASMMSSVSLKPAAFSFEKSTVRGVPSLARSTSSFKVQASGINGGMDLRDGADASGRKGKVCYLFPTLIPSSKYSFNLERVYISLSTNTVLMSMDTGITLLLLLFFSFHFTIQISFVLILIKLICLCDIPIFNTDDWSPSGDVYVGGTTGLAIWAVTLAGLLAGGALLVYNTSALAQ
ncbi:hypothetical protein FEM48_Zijuj07G0141300 [Ziziphus jujuba var. spinosa]|uniref:Photosystem II 10 kDa polypeptide, chloroplastic n=1 Tax=Ziziphus jujuba var. spinosa TaxID=714518 RepID=A0A978V529_ZIZJJ|nr:hypothetical protein FEM48_Zijuj07G0141300 [Ziziphus jujuba var. spinosa]